jgi:hypothetical protein
MLRMQQTERS